MDTWPNGRWTNGTIFIGIFGLTDTTTNENNKVIVNNIGCIYLGVTTIQGRRIAQQGSYPQMWHNSFTQRN